MKPFRAVVVTIGAVFPAPAGPAWAGKGNGAGHGISAGEILLLTKRGKNGIVEHGGGASGAMAPPLGHLKAPVNTGADRPAGQARIQRRNVTEDTVMVLHSAFGLYQTGIFETIQRDVHSAGWSCGPHRR